MTTMPDPIIGWNNAFLQAVRVQGGAPGPIARIGAMLHLTMFDIINSATGTYSSYLTTMPTPDDGVDVQDAAIYAAYAILSDQYPTQRSYFKAELLKYGGKKPTNTNVDKSFGESVAAEMLALRASDDLNNNTFVVMDAPGQWTPTGSGDAATPNWGSLTPFGGFEVTMFRPGLPSNYSTIAELLASEEYAAQYIDVMRLGSANSTERTAEQTEIALFWANDLDGTSKPPGQLFVLTQIVALKRKLSVADNARLFALVALAMADAAIVAWDAKYNRELDLWRPETAIRYTFQPGQPIMRSPLTAADPYWQPLSPRLDGTRFSPNFPAYVSGHATFGAAHAAMMRNFFGTDNISFEMTTEDPHAVRDHNGIRKTRRFTSFSSAALENARSRVYLGVHFQWDGDNGYLSGTQMADYLYKNWLTKVNEPAPVPTPA